VVKDNKSKIYFGGCRVGQSLSQSLVVHNPSSKERLRLELQIKDTPGFQILDAESTPTSRLVIKLDPRQEQTIDLLFGPKSIGPSMTELRVFPLIENMPRFLYTVYYLNINHSHSKYYPNLLLFFKVDLSGYGGSSKIHLVDRDLILIPDRDDATVWTCLIPLENQGNVDGFVCVQPSQGK